MNYESHSAETLLLVIFIFRNSPPEAKVFLSRNSWCRLPGLVRCYQVGALWQGVRGAREKQFPPVWIFDASSSVTAGVWAPMQENSKMQTCEKASNCRRLKMHCDALYRPVVFWTKVVLTVQSTVACSYAGWIFSGKCLGLVLSCIVGHALGSSGSRVTYWMLTVSWFN